MNSVESNFNCPHCSNRSYLSKKSLKDHMRKFHASSKDAKTPEPNIKEEVVTPLKDFDSPAKLAKDKKIQPILPIKNETEKTVLDKKEWVQAEHIILLDQIKQQLPVNDHFRSYRMCENLDWSKIKVGQRSGEACKEEWIKISIKIRNYRTMTELVADAKEYIENPHAIVYNKKGKHPDMPVKPLTPYFRFFIKNKAKYAQKNQNLSHSDLTKFISKKFSNLDEKRKLKYLNAYNSDMEAWKEAMIIFKKNHPEHNVDGKSFLNKTTNIPPKTSSAMQIFIQDKSASHPHSDQTKKEVYHYYKYKWTNKLSEKKKIKYIRKAIEAKQIYDIEIAEYCATHPEYKPRPIKTFLNKGEQKIKDKFDGKPIKPPSNGYSLFTVETITQLSDIPHLERLSEISKRWKDLPEHVRQAYNLKADERFREYRQELHLYLESLPEEERLLVEAEMETSTKRKSRSISSNVDRPMKPVAAVFLYIQEKMDEYRLQHPKIPDFELRRLLVKEFNCLPDKDRMKYKILEESEKERIAKESVQQISKRRRKLAKEVWPGEPSKPLSSGYMLFSKEQQKELASVKATERLQEIGKRWNQLNDQQKAEYNKKKDKLWKKYNKELEIFKKKLSPAELQLYESYHASTNTKRKKSKNMLEQACLTTDNDEDAEHNESEEESLDASESNHVPSNQDNDSDEDEDDDDDDDDDDVDNNVNDAKINGGSTKTQNDEKMLTSSSSDEDGDNEVNQKSSKLNSNHAAKIKEIYDDSSSAEDDEISSSDS